MKATSAKIELPEPQTRGGKLAEAQNGHPRLHVRTCDVANEADRAALVEWTTSRFENLNVLVNNAGIQRDIDLTHGVGELVAGENEIRINLEAPIHLSGMLVPHLSKRSGYTGMPVYAASKAGIHAFTMALRKQLEPFGIQVFEIVPPGVDTDLNPEGRAKRGGYKPDVTPTQLISAVMKRLTEDAFEIGYGMTEGFLKASRQDLDRAFERMNAD